MNRMNPKRRQSLLIFLGMILSVGCNSATQQSILAPELKISAGELELQLNDRGTLTEIRDLRGNSYSIANDLQPLLSIIAADSPEQPSTAAKRYSPKSLVEREDEDILVFTFDEQIQVEVKIDEKSGYTVLTAKSLFNPNRKDIRSLVWGPLVVSLTDFVADQLGAAYSNEFAIGVQALNPNTVGGWPHEFQHLGFHDRALDQGFNYSRTSRYSYANSAAQLIDNGAVIQMFSRDYSQTRKFEVFGFGSSRILREVPPLLNQLTGESVDVVGSSIAIFGISTPKAIRQGKNKVDEIRAAILDVTSRIELAENLPHPMFEGEWAKVSEKLMDPYLILGDLDRESIPRAAEYAKTGGMNGIYRNWLKGVFRGLGDFRVGEPFTDLDPDSSEAVADLIAAVSEAADHGVTLGSHTLSNFVGINHPEVTPLASVDLANAGYARLAEAFTLDSATVNIDDPRYFELETPIVGYARIGTEIIGYSGVGKTTNGAELTGVERGAFDTTPVESETGDKAYRLIHVSAPYNAFLAGGDMMTDMLNRLTNIVHEAKLHPISLDGLEGVARTGYGIPGTSRFVDDFYRGLGQSNEVIFDSSISTHYLWHVMSRFNWGEVHGLPAWEAHRALRWNYQAFYSRNLLQRMMGWYRIEPDSTVLEIEWMLSKAASFDAGYGIHTNLEILDNKADAQDLLKAMSLWLEATEADAFSDELRFKMREMFSFWHLERLPQPDCWRLWRVDPNSGETSDSTIIRAHDASRSSYNIAPSATVKTSSHENLSYSASKLIDGQTAAFPSRLNDRNWPREGTEQTEAGANWEYFPNLVGSGEWRAGEETNARITLTWDKPHRVETLMLFRAMLNYDKSLDVRLRLSDGTSIDDIVLFGESEYVQVEIDRGSIDWLELEIDGNHSGIGLAEIVALGGATNAQTDH